MELRGIGFVKRVGFQPGVKREGVVDELSAGEKEEEEVIGEVVDESEVEETPNHGRL